MKKNIILIGFFFFFFSFFLQAQELYEEIKLVELDTHYDVPYKELLTPYYEYKTYETDVTMFYLDYHIGMETIESFRDCFQPDIKIITAEHTFLISTITGEGLMFPNKSPFCVQELATPVKIRLDELTWDSINDLEDYLLDYEKTYFYSCNPDLASIENEFYVEEWDFLQPLKNGYLDPDIQNALDDDLLELNNLNVVDNF